MSLRERREMVGLAAEDGAEASVLFTMVGVRGSAYRQPGARVLQLRDGRTAGTLSGGCLEADLLKRGAWLVREGACVESFNTAVEDDAEIPFGLGCGGEVDVLLESAAGPEGVAALEAVERSLLGHESALATRLPADGVTLARVVVDARGDVVFATESLETEEIVQMRAFALRAELQADATVAGIVCERFEAAARLVIFGAGEDAKPLVRLATEMGWGVVVSDTRAARAAAERFPAAAQVVVAESASEVPVLASDCVVLMTHSFVQDGKLLAELLPLRPRYLGLLGARHRAAMLLEKAAVEAKLPLREAIARVHAPVGLALGGDGPEAVALAAVAEIHQVLCAGDGTVATRKGVRAVEAETAMETAR